MEAIFQKILAGDFSGIAGLTVDASIPMSESLINEIIAAAIQGDRTIQSCQVSLHEQNRVAVRLKTNGLSLPIHLKLKLDKFVDFESFSSPKIRMWLENNRWLGSLGSFFNMLPAWAKLYGNQLVIDLDALLRQSEHRKLLDLVRSVEIRTEESKAVFNVKLTAD